MSMQVRFMQLAPLGLVLGLLVGDSFVDRGPQTLEPAVSTSDSTVQPAWPHSRIPYSDSPLPVELRIPSIEVTGEVRPVGMTDAVTMQVPSDISVVGWFDRSVLPISDVGHTVLAGHRDGANDPNGVFRNLGVLREGDVVHVLDQSGRRINYEVTATELLGDQQFAQQASWIFRTHGAHRLVLITCGGTYDPERGGYQANVVVTAKRT
jgi:LPXTG-site transpeptidase (sortase) family protein